MLHHTFNRGSQNHHSANGNRVRHITTISPTDNENAIWNF